MGIVAKEGWENLISVSGEALEKKVKNNAPAVIRGYIELIDKATQILSIPQDKLKGGDADLKVIFLLGEPKAFEVLKEIKCKDKSFAQIKEELMEEISPKKSPFWDFRHHLLIPPCQFVAFKWGSETGWRGVEFEYEEKIANPLKFYQEMWNLYPITGTAINWSTEKERKWVLELLNDKADLEAGAFKYIQITTNITSGEIDWTLRDMASFMRSFMRRLKRERNIGVNWELSLYYKPKQLSI
ncbi:MAG: hypothetical protein QME61_03715 [Patescibacteria group bacterium]|nr:hypothetical protein [Patescibacteria group bacterium]